MSGPCGKGMFDRFLNVQVVVMVLLQLVLCLGQGSPQSSTPRHNAPRFRPCCLESKSASYDVVHINIYVALAFGSP